MIVRDATESDLAALEQIGREFTAAAGMPDIDPESLRATLTGLITEQSGILKVADNGAVTGALGALIFPHYWNAGEIVCQELFWWVFPKFRGSSAGMKLLTAVEASAKQKGAKRMMMLCLDAVNGEQVGQMYERLGYQPQERTFAKVI